MKIVEHQPDPAPTPPRTYDLLDLTENEMAFIEFAVMRGNFGNQDLAPRLFSGKWSLYDVLFVDRTEVSSYDERQAAVDAGAYIG